MTATVTSSIILTLSVAGDLLVSLQCRPSGHEDLDPRRRRQSRNEFLNRGD